MLIFVEIRTRRAHFAGCTAHPDNAWVTQQARQVMWELEDRDPGIRFLIRDNDKKFTDAFDTVFRSEGIDVIPTPYRAPNANAFAERWIRSVRDEHYRYTRNFYSNTPYVLWIPYRNRSPIMQEMLRLHAEGGLTGPQRHWFSEQRPPEDGPARLVPSPQDRPRA